MDVNAATQLFLDEHGNVTDAEGRRYLLPRPDVMQPLRYFFLSFNVRQTLFDHAATTIGYPSRHQICNIIAMEMNISADEIALLSMVEWSWAQYTAWCRDKKRLPSLGDDA